MILKILPLRRQEKLQEKLRPSFRLTRKKSTVMWKPHSSREKCQSASKVQKETLVLMLFAIRTL